jgi:hypothetical protein
VACSAIASTENDMRRMHMLGKHTFRSESGGGPSDMNATSDSLSSDAKASGNEPAPTETALSAQ